MRFLIFMILRLADLISTYLNMAKYDGWASIELIPWNAWLIEHIGFFPFAVVNLILSFMIMLVILRNNVLYWGLMMIMFVVVIMNFLIYFFI